MNYIDAEKTPADKERRVVIIHEGWPITAITHYDPSRNYSLWYERIDGDGLGSITTGVKYYFYLPPNP